MMNEIALSPRLQALADFAVGADVVADIGCDHGKVSLRLAQLGSHVYAADISRDSLDKARRLFNDMNLTASAEFFCGDGLQVIPKGSLDVVIIAGMGELTIIDIMERSSERFQQIPRIVLQPMDGTYRVRDYLERANYAITNETLVKDEGRLYTVIVAQYRPGMTLTLAEKLLGPCILRTQPTLLEELLEREIQRRQVILNGLAKSQNPDRTLYDKKSKELLHIEKVRHDNENNGKSNL